MLRGAVISGATGARLSQQMHEGDPPATGSASRAATAAPGSSNQAVRAFARVRFSLPDADPARFHVALQKDLPYRPTGDGAHTLDVYMPTTAPKPQPTLLYVHGGGFSMLSKDTHRGMAIAYARRGYLVFNINYRLGPKHLLSRAARGRGGGTPLCPRQLRLLRSRPVASGARGRVRRRQPRDGAHALHVLASAGAVREEAVRRGDISVSERPSRPTGFLDLESLEHYETHPRLSSRLKDLLLHAAASYVGLDVRAGAAAAPLASPLLVLERAAQLDRPLPPFFADAGTRDPLLGDSRRLKAAIERHGGTCTSSTSRQAKSTATTRWSGAIPPGRSGAGCTSFSLPIWRPATNRAQQKRALRSRSTSRLLESRRLAWQRLGDDRQRHLVRSDRRDPRHGLGHLCPRAICARLEALRLRVHREDHERGVTPSSAAPHAPLDHHGRQREGRGGQGARGRRAAALTSKPGEDFEYTSGCVLQTSRGEMRGTYQMYRPDGSGFDATIAPFALALPYSLN